MTLLLKPKKSKKQQLWSVYQELSRIYEKNPQKAHQSVVMILYNQQKHIQKLTENDKELWLQVKKYEDKLQQHSASQSETTDNIMRRIWDNKEDEFWDTL